MNLRRRVLSNHHHFSSSLTSQPQQLPVVLFGAKGRLGSILRQRWGGQSGGGSYSYGGRVATSIRVFSKPSLRHSPWPDHRSSFPPGAVVALAVQKKDVEAACHEIAPHLATHHSILCMVSGTSPYLLQQWLPPNFHNIVCAASSSAGAGSSDGSGVTVFNGHHKMPRHLLDSVVVALECLSPTGGGLTHECPCGDAVEVSLCKLLPPLPAFYSPAAIIGCCHCQQVGKESIGGNQSAATPPEEAKVVFGVEVAVQTVLDGNAKSSSSSSNGGVRGKIWVRALSTAKRNTNQ